MSNRRPELVETARQLFALNGYAGTSVADLVGAVGMSKAAFGYHVGTKEALLHEMVEPLLDELEGVVSAHPPQPSWPDGVRALLSDYLDVLILHRDTVVWIDGDKSVLNHPELGDRLKRNSRKIRARVTGGTTSAASRLGASSVLGALWRPIRNLPEIDPGAGREAILESAVAAAGAVRSL